jgi:hypothetical protein
LISHFGPIRSPYAANSQFGAIYYHLLHRTSAKNPSAGRISALRCRNWLFIVTATHLDAQPEQHQQRAPRVQQREYNQQRAARNKLRNQWRRGQPYERHKKVKYNAAERFEDHTFSGDHIKLAAISHGSSASSAGARPKISAGGRGEKFQETP